MQLRHAPRDRFITANSLRFHMLDWGDPSAPPVLLLHGFSDNAHTFDQTADRLCERYHVLALDQRGHGDTDWSHDGYEREKYAEDVAKITETLRIGRFVLLGRSMGGLNAMEYAARHSGTVEGLIIVDVGPEIIKEGGARIQRHTQSAPDAFDSLERVYQHMRATEPRMPEDVMRYRVPFAVRQRSDGQWVLKYDKALRSPDRPAARGTPTAALWNALPEIRCPTLVIRGAETDILSPETAQRMVKALPNGSLVDVPNAGHMVHLDNFPAFFKAVDDFLRG